MQTSELNMKSDWVGWVLLLLLIFNLLSAGAATCVGVGAVIDAYHDHKGHSQ